MSEEQMLKCLIAFILGYLLSRMMGNGFSVGAKTLNCTRTNSGCPSSTVLNDAHYSPILSPSHHWWTSDSCECPLNAEGRAYARLHPEMNW